MNAPWWWQRRFRRPGRRQYTQAEIAAADCFRCGDPATFQWQCCADGNTWRPLCLACDLALNALVLDWMGHPNADQLMAAYTVEVTEDGG